MTPSVASAPDALSGAATQPFADAATATATDAVSVSVVVVTMNRPDCVRHCLEHLRAQSAPVQQVIVVDASRDGRTRAVVREFPEVEYVANSIGYGHMTHSRNKGLERTTSDIVAFLDDDSYAHPTWRAEIVAPYAHRSVGAVGGRALRGIRGEEQVPEGEVGRLKPNGMLSGNFSAQRASDLEVFHLAGCNMSFRRAILARLGGLREDYTGTEVREETDVCLRVGRLGYRVIFAPRAVVDHVGAPQVKGQRSDLRYDFYSRRNHFAFLVRNFGPLSPILWRFVPLSVWRSLKPCFEGRKSAPLRFIAQMLGGALGIAAGLRLWLKTGIDPVRADTRGRQLQRLLSRPKQP